MGIITDKNKHLKIISKNLGFGFIIFNNQERVKKISKGLATKLRIPYAKIQKINYIFPKHFFQDIFHGEQSIFRAGDFANYRLWLTTFDGKKDLLFNISGYLTDEQEVSTIWQLVDLEELKRFGSLNPSLHDSIKVQEIIKPYIPPIVLKKAKEALLHGRREFEPESKVITVLFADLMDFTAQAEYLDSQELVNMLNIAFHVIVNSIMRNGGTVDKFMGDAVMALFEDADAAILAAMEIQTHFREVNEMRQLTGEQVINVRIGINSGRVIFGSIGIQERMDWTALGDVVNIASRVETGSEPGNVFITQDTYSLLQNLIEIKETFYWKLKGKSYDVPVMQLASVQFTRRGQNNKLSIF